MAVDFGDHVSGFRHNEVTRFINNEILLNGGGPDFYMALRSRPWNEVEDRLQMVVSDPRVPRDLKRSCMWSALALSVRAGTRQREQQARRLRRLQEQVEEREALSRAIISELQQVQQECEVIAKELQSTRAALQQVQTECDVLRVQLHQVQRSSLPTHLPQEMLPGMPPPHPGSVPWPPNAGQAHALPMGTNPGMFFDFLLPAPPPMFYVPGHGILWPQQMHPPVFVPLPYLHPLLPLGFFCFPAVFMETDGFLVPPFIPPLPVCYPGLLGPMNYHNVMNPLWYQRGHVQGQHPGVLQGQPPGIFQGPCPVIFPGQFPGVFQGQFPGVFQGQSPGVFQGQSPGVFQGPSPGLFQGQSPGGFQGQSPGVFRGQSPGVFQGQSPGVFQAQSPGVFQGQSTGVFHRQSTGVFQGQSPGVFQGLRPGIFLGKSPGAFQGSRPGVSQSVPPPEGIRINPQERVQRPQGIGPFSDNLLQSQEQYPERHLGLTGTDSIWNYNRTSTERTSGVPPPDPDNFSKCSKVCVNIESGDLTPRTNLMFSGW